MERFSDDILSEGDVADELYVDENSLDINRLLDNLREEIKYDESIAMKSAMLLKLLEVSGFRRCCEMQFKCEFDDVLDWANVLKLFSKEKLHPKIVTLMKLFRCFLCVMILIYSMQIFFVFLFHSVIIFLATLIYSKYNLNSL